MTISNDGANMLTRVNSTIKCSWYFALPALLFGLLSAQSVTPPTRISSSKLTLDAERASEEWRNTDKTLVQDVFSGPPDQMLARIHAAANRMRNAKDKQYALYENLRADAADDAAALDRDPGHWTEYASRRKADLDAQLDAVETEEVRLRDEIQAVSTESYSKKAEMLGMLQSQLEVTKKFKSNLLEQRREFEKVAAGGAEVDQRRRTLIQSLHDEEATFAQLAEKTQIVKTSLDAYYTSLESIVQGRRAELNKKGTSLQSEPTTGTASVSIGTGRDAYPRLGGVWQKHNQNGSRSCPCLVEIDVNTQITSEHQTDIRGRFKAWFGEPIQRDHPNVQFDFAGPFEQDHASYQWRSEDFSSGVLELTLINDTSLRVISTGQPPEGSTALWKMCSMTLERKEYSPEKKGTGQKAPAQPKNPRSESKSNEIEPRP